jgi:hypothetical protein
VSDEALKKASESEVDLCDRLRDWAERLGFDVYPEVHGWDMVLVSSEPRTLGRYGLAVAPGQQVGIHAKLRPSCEVLAQAIVDPAWRRPHFPFVAVPQAGQGFRVIARHLGIGIILSDSAGRRLARWGESKDPQITVSSEPPRDPGEVKPLELPPIASRAISAGAPSPRVLSPWRVKALRFLKHARAEGTFRVSTVLGFGLSKAWVERWGDPIDWTVEIKRGKQVRVRVYKLVEKSQALPDFGYEDVAQELWKAEEAAA